MVLEITKDNFEAEIKNSDKPVIIDFWAPWCGPCQMMGPVFEELAGEMDKYKFVKVNVEAEQELAQEFGIASIPTLAAFKDGKEANRVMGFMPKDVLQEKIESMME